MADNATKAATSASSAAGSATRASTGGSTAWQATQGLSPSQEAQVREIIRDELAAVEAEKREAESRRPGRSVLDA